MTLAYDIERLVVLCEQIKAVVAEVNGHDVPLWLSSRASDLAFVADGLRRTIERDRVKDETCDTQE